MSIKGTISPLQKRKSTVCFPTTKFLILVAKLCTVSFPIINNYTTHLIEKELLANDGYQYTYNLMGNITAVKTGTRANMSTLSNYPTYTYDAKGELIGETFYSGGSSTQRTYAYDGLGNLTSQTQTGVLGAKSIAYTYGTSSSAGWGKMLNSVSIPSLLK